MINFYQSVPAARGGKGLHLAPLNARVTLEAGFTTVRDVGCIRGSNFVDVSLRNAIAKRLVPGPRMLVARNLIGATGGHCDFTGSPKFLPRYRQRAGLYRRGC
jgi:imidazolonepropionase-like amidohydrolase